jgi:hypothetical protein
MAPYLSCKVLLDAALVGCHNIVVEILWYAGLENIVADRAEGFVFGYDAVE